MHVAYCLYVYCVAPCICALFLGIGIYLSRLTENCIFGSKPYPVVRHPQILRTPLSALITGYQNNSHTGWALRPVVFITIVHVLTEGMSSA